MRVLVFREGVPVNHRGLAINDNPRKVLWTLFMAYHNYQVHGNRMEVVKMRSSEILGESAPEAVEFYGLVTSATPMVFGGVFAD